MPNKAMLKNSTTLLSYFALHQIYDIVTKNIEKLIKLWQKRRESIL